MSLVTLAAMKTYLEIAVLDTTQDAFVTTLLDAATDAIENLCFRALRQASFVHQINGNGTHELITREFPVTAVSQVNVDPAWTFAAGTIVSASNYFVGDEAFLVGKSVWAQGIRNVRISYTAGYAPGAIPEDLQLATKFFVQYAYKIRRDESIGVQNRGKNGETLTFFESIPKPVLDLIAPYVRERALADLYRRKDGGP